MQIHKRSYEFTCSGIDVTELPWITLGDDNEVDNDDDDDGNDDEVYKEDFHSQGITISKCV